MAMHGLAWRGVDRQGREPFSTRDERYPQMLTQIIVDSREPPSIRELTFGGVEKVVLPLDYASSGGSYDLAALCDDGALLVVERATPSDLLGKIRDDRLLPQLAQLREQSPWAYLVIPGKMWPDAAGNTVVVDSGGMTRESHWRWSSIQGMLLTAQEMGINVVSCGSNDEYEQCIINLSNRKRDAVRVAPARDVEMLTEQEALLAALPGIGRERAALLLSHCGSPAWALEWLACNSPDVDPIPGIGIGTRRRVRQALQLPDNQRLTIWTIDETSESEVRK